MKKKTINKKMLLNKQTIANLGDEQMDRVKGGKPPTSFTTFTCTCWHTDLDENCPTTSRNLLLCDTDGEICF
jgi:hypothetical protein